MRSVISGFCVAKTTFRSSLTRAVTVSRLADLVRMQSLGLNVVFFTQKPLITLKIAAPHGMTVSSNVATVPMGVQYLPWIINEHCLEFRQFLSRNIAVRVVPDLTMQEM